MIITVRNNAEVPSKYERRIKWLLYNLQQKFQSIIYANVFFKKEGSSHPIYNISLVVGIPGQDVIINTRGAELSKLVYDAYNSAKRSVIKKLSARK